MTLFPTVRIAPPDMNTRFQLRAMRYAGPLASVRAVTFPSTNTIWLLDMKNLTEDESVAILEHEIMHAIVYQFIGDYTVSEKPDLVVGDWDEGSVLFQSKFGNVKDRAQAANDYYKKANFLPFTFLKYIGFALDPNYNNNAGTPYPWQARYGTIIFGNWENYSRKLRYEIDPKPLEDAVADCLSHETVHIALDEIGESNWSKVADKSIGCPGWEMPWEGFSEEEKRVGKEYLYTGLFLVKEPNQGEMP